MPRRPRFCPAGMPVHVVQRGNNRQVCFAKEADMIAYANWLGESAKKFDVEIHGWVLMTNHVHLLLTPKDEYGVSKLMQTLGRLYVRYFNYGYQRTGTLFEGRYKSSVVQQEEYFLNCLRYIELNPVRAGMVNDPGDYKWSSYRAHAFGVKVKRWTPHAMYTELAGTEIERQSHYRKWMSEAMATEVLGKIRACLEKGLVLGTDRFREQVVSLKR
jgi:putative transposase